MIKFYNSLTRQKEEFKPMNEKEVGMYSCGPTVYNYAHIGNFRAYIFSDLVRRVLEDYGYNVKLVMNLTDVDDKTIRNSKENHISLSEYTKKYKEAFFEDIKTLRIKPATVNPSATEHINEMIDIIKLLEKNGHTYEADGSIYFKISTFPEYGELANLDKQELKEGASGRVSSDEYDKENASDFVLWKAYTEEDGDVYWDSPFGKGRPGWHIECSAMSCKYLGKHFDIHTGGVDNKFPHHENEIAQNEAAFNEKFVNYWLHCEHLIVDGEKMSKSKGNFYTLRDLLNKGLSAEAIRYSLMNSHYRKQLNFTIEGINQSQSAIDRVNDLIFRLKDVNKTDADDSAVMKELEEANKNFFESIYDDLNVSEALGVFFSFIKSINISFDSINVSSRDAIIKFIERVNNIINCFNMNGEKEIESSEEEKINKLIEERTLAKKEKNYKRADEIRDELNSMGIEIMDTPNGVRWKRK
ncbi:cysteine--tRNA ligase [Brachyspira pilosicoli]|uniref:Cysteine--tRNA ligase n=3 Tax=Brachyspira pilosicoli TaxID=52584 RepID=K0JMX1_BRAPL|nr:cysteine--tRNA ligase [Brachyspira pilosicoli]AFR69638.1 cysteinyl tRNA-synthetase [Brachyspira pilosicoli B2904]MBW5378095.1 cysteine--tRNA ligase [Brachyspira pilosicoli]MBW5391529.1 cysteine--tRNA ligase [Brachyspira pilosicoli]MBW5400089.1 cysteine--tRNA ligase [Brachyspira pilosicoli]WIH85370.1 cysteine--tRNA ligase [Brachyspira pilosicoli]